jgi:hypothetical protein
MIENAVTPLYALIADLQAQVDGRVPYGDEVNLAAWGGLYLSAENGGPAVGQPFKLIGATTADRHEAWTLTRGKSKG